mgnify:CR=1 FL=1
MFAHHRQFVRLRQRQVDRQFECIRNGELLLEGVSVDSSERMIHGAMFALEIGHIMDHRVHGHGIGRAVLSDHGNRDKRCLFQHVPSKTLVSLPLFSPHNRTSLRFFSSLPESPPPVKGVSHAESSPTEKRRDCFSSKIGNLTPRRPRRGRREPRRRHWASSCTGRR